MSIIRKRNPITGEWETFSVTSASEMPILDIKDNFTSKNVEGALRELSDKNAEINSKVSAQSTVISEQSTAISEHSSTLRVHAEDIAWLKENGGGGGGGTSAPTITSKFEDGTIVQKGEDVKIPIFFTSPNQGNGIAYIVIDGIEVASVEGIKQGNNTINIGKLSNLRNNVAIYVKDRTNALSNQLEWTIICGGIDLEVNFDDTADYGVTDQIIMQFTVQSASTEPIIMHMTIDYDTYEVECTQGVNEYMFVGLAVGVHKVSFYLTSGEYRTNTVNYNIVVVNSNSLFVSSSFEEGQFTYGTPIPVEYRVSKASDEYFEVKLYLNDVLQKTLSVQAGTYYWTINDVEIGTHNIRIEVRSAYNEEFIINKTFEVVAGNYTPLKITEAGLVYRLNAKGRTNQDSDRAEPRDNSGNGIAARLYNFNWYTNGWIDDELVCDSNAYVEIDCYPWSENAIYGSTIEVQFTGLDIGFNDARIFDYTDIETPYKGVYIDLEESTMKSLANTGKVNIDKDVETTVSFAIDRKNKFGKIYIDGICSRAFSLSDTGSGTSAVREDFTHNQKIYLNSRKGLDKFGACKIKDIRIYSRTLSDDEIVQNNIAQVTDLDAQEKLYKLNYENTTLPTIKMYGDTTNMTLETPVTMRIKYTSPNEDKYGQSFDLPYCQVNWQGTSSLQYVLKNFTARLKDENMADYYYTPYSNGVLENVYCFKCDYMESTHSRNVGLAKFVNDCLYDTKNPAQQKDDKIRNSIAGFPCLLYINDELQGVYNFNLDRYSTRPFGYTDPDKCIVYEVSANSDTTAGAFYKWSEASGKSQLDYYKSDFECLYPPTRAAGNDNMSELIRLIEWVNDSSDEDFKDNIGRYFNLEYLLRYYLFVLVFGAVDSLGKNMKLATWDGLVWYPQVYDADTTIGLDNTGFLKFDMDIEMGDENVFNTTGSQLWRKVVLLFDAELKAQYSLMRQDRFTVDNIMKYLYGEQISQIPAYYYNKDMQSKYLNFGSSYLYALHGSGEQHIRKWIRERLMYCDTLLGYRASSSDYITLRSSKLGEVYLDVETYIPMYLSIKWRDEANNTGLQTKRIGRGEKVRFTYNMPTATDQEIIVYAGYYLKSLGDVSNLQPTSMLIANASRLTEIECHSPNLINTDLSECTKLQRIDLSDCTALGTGIGAQPILNIQNCKYLRYCNCMNTQLTAIYTMQAGGNLEEIYYPQSTQVVQLTNQTYLHTIGLPSTNPCENLANVQITNCNAVKSLSSETTALDFNTFKYVQNLNITNSLSGLNSMQFNGFDKLKNVTLSSLKELDSIGFEDMMPVATTSTLKNITISDCPLITSLSFNVSSDNYKVAFATNGVLDLGGLQSLNTIECNYSIKGLDTLIIPTSLKKLQFATDYGDGVNDIKNIWSVNAVHSNDGFEGLDFLDITLEYIDMLGLSKVENAINFNLAPVSQHPNLNTARDGSADKPWFHPTGTINLNNYEGNMANMLKGIDLNKFTVELDIDKTQTDLTNFLYSAIGCDIDKISNIVNKFPKANIRDYMFAYSDIPAPLELPTNIKKLSAKGMYKGTNITTDLDLPTTNLIAVDEMFMDCVNIVTVHENWNKSYTNEITTTNCYKGLPNDMVDEIPIPWGGNGFEKDYTTIFELNLPNDGMTITVNERQDIKGACNTNWGDGSPIGKEKSHTYTTAGRYIVKFRNSYMGNPEYQHGNYMKYVSRYLNVPKYSFNNTGKPDLITSITLYSHNSLESIDWNVFRCKDNGINYISFSNMKSPYITEIDLSNITFSPNGVSLDNAFSNCNQLITITAPNLVVTNANSAFSGCTELTDIIGLDTWNISKCANFNAFVKKCSLITEVQLQPLSTWDMSNVSNINEMCSSSGIRNTSFCATWNVPRVTSLNSTFSFSKLEEVDLSGWTNTNNIKDFGGVWNGTFQGCKNLVTVNLSGIVTSAFKQISFVFEDCPKLTTIIGMETWDVTNVTSYERWIYGTSNIVNINKIFSPFIPNLDRYNSIRNNSKLSVDSLVSMLEALYDYVSAGDTDVHTFQIGSTNLAKLTAEQIAIATNKGWTISA